MNDKVMSWIDDCEHVAYIFKVMFCSFPPCFLLKVNYPLFIMSKMPNVNQMLHFLLNIIIINFRFWVYFDVCSRSSLEFSVLVDGFG